MRGEFYKKKKKKKKKNVIPAQAGIHCVADNLSLVPAGQPTPSLRDTPPRGVRMRTGVGGELYPPTHPVWGFF